MLINTSKSAEKNLIDLINADNGTALTSAEISIGVPAVWDELTDTGSDTGNDRNTKVTVSAVANSGYKDSVDIRYYRLDLDTLRGGVSLEHTKSEASTVQSVIDAIATQVDLIETELALFDETGTELSSLVALSEPKVYTVRAKADSVCYIGQMDVTINPIPVPEVPVGDEVTTTDMSGFEYPA